MTTFVLLVWMAGPGAGNVPARVDEYRTIEACEAAGRAWTVADNPHPRRYWVCLPGDGRHGAMTTSVLLVWLEDPKAAHVPARVDEYRTIEACEAAGRAWTVAFDNPRRRAAAQWACLPGERFLDGFGDRVVPDDGT